MEAVIRKAQTEDFEGAFALVLELREHFADNKPVDKEVLRDIFERFLAQADNYVYVAGAEGGIVGVMSMYVGVTLYDDRPYASIEMLIVAPGLRGQGLGKRFLDVAFARAKERGCGEIGVDTSTDNEGAIRFYREYGFDQESILFEKEID